MTVEGVNGVNGPKDTYYVSGGGQTNQSETTTNVDMAQAKGNTSDAGFEASGLSITKEDVKVAQDELGIRTSAKTKERVAAMRNEYAQKILSSCAEGCPPELKGVAMAYVQELPMASRGRDIQNFKAACEAKLDAFRGTAQRMGLGIYLMQMEENNQSRHDLAEVSADFRQTETKLTVVQIGLGVNEHIDQTKDEIKETVIDQCQKTRVYTGRKINSAVGKIKRHVTAVGKQCGDRVTRNVASLVGNRTVGETRQVTDESGNTHEEFVVTNGDGSKTGFAPEETVNGHTTAETNRGIKTNVENTAAIAGLVYGDNHGTDGEGHEVLRVNDGSGNYYDLDYKDTINGQTQNEGTKTRIELYENTKTLKQQNEALKKKLEEALGLLRARGGNEGGSAPANEG